MKLNVSRVKVIRRPDRNAQKGAYVQFWKDKLVLLRPHTAMLDCNVTVKAVQAFQKIRFMSSLTKTTR